MWKKDNNPDQPTPVAAKPAFQGNQAPGQSNVLRSSSTPPTRSAKGGTSAISADIVFNGKIHGKSDIVISGQFEGSIELPDNSVTVELSGKVNASSIVAKTITIIGTVEGTLNGRELIQVMSSGNVVGDIKSEKIVLENGCKFKGTIETTPSAKETASPPKTPPSPAPSSMSTGKPSAPAVKPDSSPSSKLA